MCVCVCLWGGVCLCLLVYLPLHVCLSLSLSHIHTHSHTDSFPRTVAMETHGEVANRLVGYIEILQVKLAQEKVFPRLLLAVQLLCLCWSASDGGQVGVDGQARLETGKKQNSEYKARNTQKAAHCTNKHRETDRHIWTHQH